MPHPRQREGRRLSRRSESRSPSLPEPHIERREHKHDPDVCEQPLPEQMSEEQDVHANHDGIGDEERLGLSSSAVLQRRSNGSGPQRRDQAGRWRTLKNRRSESNEDPARCKALHTRAIASVFAERRKRRVDWRGAAMRSRPLIASDRRGPLPRSRAEMRVTRPMTRCATNTRRSPLASRSVPGHLLRGVLGLILAGVAVALCSVVGPIALTLLPLTAVAWRGCPTCWTIGLFGTLADPRARSEYPDI